MLRFLRIFSSNKRDLSKDQQQKLDFLESLIGIKINNPDLFFRALTHRSKLADEKLHDSESYEQLEFLGDSVLDLLVSEILFEKYPRENEGFMTKSRSKLVKGVTLAKLAKKLDLSSYLDVGERARGQGVEFSNSVLADVFEALIGAIYRDQGYDASSKFVRMIYAKHVQIERIIKTQDNYKSTLLEHSQAHKLPIPTYAVISESGPAHNKEFHVGVYLGHELTGDGRGQNKKNAEQAAALKALKNMKIEFELE